MKTLQGTIVRVNDARTAKVEVERNWQHPLYKKYVKRTKSYLCDIPVDMEVEVGNQVVIIETRPMSKLKKFAITAKAE